MFYWSFHRNMNMLYLTVRLPWDFIGLQYHEIILLTYQHTYVATTLWYIGSHKEVINHLHRPSQIFMWHSKNMREKFFADTNIPLSGNNFSRFTSLQLLLHLTLCLNTSDMSMTNFVFNNNVFDPVFFGLNVRLYFN